MSAALDYAMGGEALYTGGMEGDIADARAMQPFSPDPSVPWWQNLAAYGITRAIDNRFGPASVQGNTAPGSFAGQDGRTYTNSPSGHGGGATSASGGIPSWLMLAALGAVVLLVVVKA